jgi:Trypsin-co-occurring domain 2
VVEIELADAVAAVRSELLEAAGRDAGTEVGFVVGPIELEFAVELRVDAKAKFGFKAWVVSGEGEAGVARGRTHRVKVTLSPKRADGGDLLISGGGSRAVGPGPVEGHIGR